MITNCNYRIIKNSNTDSQESLIESLKGIDATTIMIASFDNQISDAKVSKESHNQNQKYFTVLDSQNHNNEWWLLIGDPKRFTSFESKDLKKCKYKQSVINKLRGRYGLKEDDTGMSIMSIKEYQSIFH